MRMTLVTGLCIALAACGGDTGSSTASAAADPAPVATDSSLVGTYGGTTEAGDPWTSALAADGTYRNTVAGEVSETGTWQQDGDQLCFTPAPGSGDAPPQTCLRLVKVNADGSLVLADSNGEQTTAPRLAGG